MAIKNVFRMKMLPGRFLRYNVNGKSMLLEPGSVFNARAEDVPSILSEERRKKKLS